MNSLVASAPGKLVLCGEYAVLDGAPAISAAVDQRAVVSLHDEVVENADVQVTTAGYRDGHYAYRILDGKLVAAREQSALPLLEAVWDSLSDAPALPMNIELDTSDFSLGDTKLGLGSSAALAVALLGGLLRREGSDQCVLESSHAAHTWLQGGRGSGVDVFTSFSGGVIRFDKREVPTAQALNWPEGLEARVLFSGVPASTADRLAILERLGHRPTATALADAAERAADAWQNGTVDEVLEATSSFSRCLAAFSDDYGLDVFGSGHTELAALATERGLVYKPSGAGGGDAGIVLGDNASGVDAFVELAETRGFAALDIHLGGKTEAKGLTVEWTPA